MTIRFLLLFSICGIFFINLNAQSYQLKLKVKRNYIKYEFKITNNNSKRISTTRPIKLTQVDSIKTDTKIYIDDGVTLIDIDSLESLTIIFSVNKDSFLNHDSFCYIIPIFISNQKKCLMAVLKKDSYKYKPTTCENYQELSYGLNGRMKKRRFLRINVF